MFYCPAEKEQEYLTTGLSWLRRNMKELSILCSQPSQVLKWACWESCIIIIYRRQIWKAHFFYSNRRWNICNITLLMPKRNKLTGISTTKERRMERMSRLVGCLSSPSAIPLTSISSSSFHLSNGYDITTEIVAFQCDIRKRNERHQQLISEVISNIFSFNSIKRNGRRTDQFFIIFFRWSDG